LKNNPLFIKLGGAILILLTIIGISCAWITSYVSQQYFLESHQQLNKELAQFTVDHVNTFDEAGNIDKKGASDIMEAMMVINPSVEVYLLDNEGTIINHVAPYKKVVREKVSLAPIKEFIAKKGELFIRGDDPRNFDLQKIFSAAPVYVNENIMGYYYIVLASEAQASVMNDLRGCFALTLGSRLLGLALVAAGILALLALWYITRNLSNITSTMDRFRSGDYTARIVEGETGDFKKLAVHYNAMAQQISENIEKIKSVEVLRRELIANVSHDLRTPLSVIQGYLETLQMKAGNISAEQRDKYLGHIHESSKRLTGLVNQLFELSKLESNQIKVNKEPFLVHELADDLVQRYSLQAEKKNVKIRVRREDNLPAVYADVGLVERVFQNLIDNALKYTPEGGFIELRFFNTDGGVEVEVADNGPGIPEKDQKHIFERYRKSTGDQQVQGTGLGLAIVKKILDIHQSTIQVISAPDEGCRFQFQLPAMS